MYIHVHIYIYNYIHVFACVTHAMYIQLRKFCHSKHTLMGMFHLQVITLYICFNIHYRYPKGSVVLIILNTIDTEAIVTLTNDELINSDQDIYWLTPSPVTNITSQ